VMQLLLPLLFRFPDIARLLLMTKPAPQPLPRCILGGLAVGRNKQLVSTTSSK
jgi:hypothetical protein